VTNIIKKVKGITKTSTTRSQEDYLEALYILEKEKPVIFVRDIAQYLKVSLPSVTGMLQTLSKKEFITYKPNGYVLLAKKGKVIARKILQKHNELKEFLSYIIGIPDKEAADFACRIEHSISGKASNRLALFVRFIRMCPRCGDNLIKHFNHFLKEREICKDKCLQCVRACYASLGRSENDGNAQKSHTNGRR
jgi:DtxR family Mn-dependent transcriptional regulator